MYKNNNKPGKFSRAREFNFDINHLILLEHNTNCSLSHAFCGDRFQLFIIEEILLFAKILNACMYIIPFKYVHK